MKVITLQQPWASLSVIGAKRIETRRWHTQHRGTLLIHAGKAKPGKNRMVANTEQFRRYLDTGTQLAFDPFDLLPFGSIIGMVDIIDCIPTRRVLDMTGAGILGTKVMPLGGHAWHITPDELAFGDYSGNRYAWMMANVVKFERPIPISGHLSLWDYEQPGMAAELHQLASIPGKQFSQPLTMFK